MKLYVIAGEDSGDMHAAGLIRSLRGQLPELEVRGVGGEKLEQAGAVLTAHVRDINFMGFWEVITHLPVIRRLFRAVQADISTWHPDVVILVDYPGFNLRMAPFIRRLGIPVIYYISPQLWAWKKGRIEIIRRYVNRLLVILPFEKEFYQQEGLEVDFVGHPLLDYIGDPPPRTAGEIRTIALLPGSRRQEIRRMLPVMLAMTDRFPEAEFVIAGAPSQSPALYHQLMGNTRARLVMGQTYEVLRTADLAAVTSGTATLETALFGVPEVVCYRGSALSYEIGRRLVQVPFISLVNLIMGQAVVDELIQYDLNPDRLEQSLRRLMEPAIRSSLAAQYTALRAKLGDTGASGRAAQAVLTTLSWPPPVVS
ncbi:MAG: lipid-A-disaccharide synthase [Bacteroidia bacterium]|nr:lipid-A-disaccharide synthase [Bacteroidia bacterium]